MGETEYRGPAKHRTVANNESVARGFIPAGSRSGPSKPTPDHTDTTRTQLRGLLRSPAGINPLGTINPLATADDVRPSPLGSVLFFTTTVAGDSASCLAGRVLALANQQITLPSPFTPSNSIPLSPARSSRSFTSSLTINAPKCFLTRKICFP